MSLDGFFCEMENGELFEMNNPHFPKCFDPFRHPSFIVPVVVSGILVIIVLVTIGLLYYNRHTKPVRQIRECFEMNPARFVHAALQYVTAKKSTPCLTTI